MAFEDCDDYLLYPPAFNIFPGLTQHSADVSFNVNSTHVRPFRSCNKSNVETKN